MRYEEGVCLHVSVYAFSAARQIGWDRKTGHKTESKLMNTRAEWDIELGKLHTAAV